MPEEVCHTGYWLAPHEQDRGKRLAERVHVDATIDCGTLICDGAYVRVGLGTDLIVSFFATVRSTTLAHNDLWFTDPDVNLCSISGTMCLSSDRTVLQVNPDRAPFAVIR